MTTDEARGFIIIASLTIIGGQMIFLFTAPVFGFPLTYSRSLDLLQIVGPVFLGYLGSAAHFVFKAPPQAESVGIRFLGLLVKGPIIIYALALVAAFGAFGYTNRVGVRLDDGGGMSVDNLATALSIALGLLAAVTGVLTSYLFVTDRSSSAASKIVAATGEQ